MRKKSIKFEHQPRDDGDLKKGLVLYIFKKYVRQVCRIWQLRQLGYENRKI